MGLVAEVFQKGVLDTLPGSSAIGHNRYSTSGESSPDNAQPVRVTYHGGALALGHNGQLVNAATIRRRMEAAGSIFQTTSDSEILVHLIAASRESTMEARLVDALRQVEGAFSITVLAGDAVYAARDSHGFRPLVVGKLDQGLIVASETCALDIVEAEFLREVEPGEVVRIDKHGLAVVGHLPRTDLHHCVFELIYFARPDSTVFGESVDRVRRLLGRRLAREHPAPVDCVIAVPDSSNSAALGFAEESGLPFELGLIRNHYIGRTFIRPGQRSREAGVRVKYNMVRSLLYGKSIAVIDDSIVRGTTSQKLVKLLRRGGVREIHFRVASPPVMGPCYYGIDTPSRAELIAANHDLESIREYLGVDSLGYLSEEGLRTCVSRPDDHCYACFTTRYPIPPDREIRAGKGDIAPPVLAEPAGEPR
jgi:amidophosphoribosyltransferase